MVVHAEGVLGGVEFLRQISMGEQPEIGRQVVVIGGGDTGSDCVGTANRQGAASVTSIELLERPPEDGSPASPWPMWKHKYRSSSSHDEGGRREYAMMTKRFVGKDGRVVALEGVEHLHPVTEFLAGLDAADGGTTRSA